VLELEAAAIRLRRADEAVRGHRLPVAGRVASEPFAERADELPKGVGER
jgi:hypothetical protein